MKLALQQAGSIFTGWINSCLFCLSPADNESTHQQVLKHNGVQREMKICHHQPHLVPPMRLVFYDNLPSPTSPPRASSMPSWAMEGKNRASRASSRASMSLRRKSTASRLRISAPTDFRRVHHPPLTRSETPKPLELSIYTPGNRLSDLPTFERFDLEDGSRLPTLPARALSSSLERSRHRATASQHQLLRKPVGSGSRRLSLAPMDQLLDKQQERGTAILRSPLIPHFSTRIPSTTTALPAKSDSSHGDRPAPLIIHQRRNPVDSPSTIIPTKETINLQDRPLPPLPTAEEPSRRPSTGASPSSESPSTPSSSSRLRSGRVAQWLLFSSSKNSPPPKHAPTHIRSRTLSGSTVSSSVVTTCVTGAIMRPTTPSLSSAITAATTVRPSIADPRPEKDLELTVALDGPMDYYSHPTIYEGEQQLQASPEGYGYSADYHSRYRESVVGLAF